MSKKQSGRSATGVRNAPAKAPAAPVQEKSFGQSALEWTKSLAMGFILFIILRTFLIQTFTITSGSMEGTLLVGDFLVLSKSAYGATVPGTHVRLPGYTDPHRGDIIVFRGHHEPIDLVKRLVGMPGDTLSMHAAVLYLNGEARTEPYVRHTYPGGDGTHEWMVWQSNYLVDSVDKASYHPTRDNWGPIVVPPMKYFAMGDNRDESLDSRYWGFVEDHEIKGKATILYFSYDSSGATSVGPVPILSHIRWNRIGDRLH